MKRSAIAVLRLTVQVGIAPHQQAHTLTGSMPPFSINFCAAVSECSVHRALDRDRERQHTDDRNESFFLALQEEEVQRCAAGAIFHFHHQKDAEMAMALALTHAVEFKLMHTQRRAEEEEEEEASGRQLTYTAHNCHQ